jgi:hypothetical protein
MKIREYVGFTVIDKKKVDSDEESIKPEADPILVGVKGKGYCFLCRKEGPKYLCKYIYCEETVRKIVWERSRGRFFPMSKKEREDTKALKKQRVDEATFKVTKSYD